MVEAAGMMSNPKYAAKMQQKRLLANELGVKVLFVLPEHTLTLDEMLAPWISGSDAVAMGIGSGVSLAHGTGQVGREPSR
jgi:hypothetical protein